MKLEHIRELNEQIRKEVRRVEEIRSRAFPGAIRYDTIGGSHGSPANKMEDVLCRVDAEWKKARLLNNLREEEKREAVKKIQSLGLTCAQRHILYLRYLARHEDLTNFSWPDVFKFVNLHHNIERRRMFQLHQDAMEKLNNH